MRRIEALTTRPNERSENERQWRTLIAALLILDALCVLGSLTLAYVIRIDGLLPYYAEAKDEVYRSLVIIAIPLYLACFAALGLYQRDNLLGGIVEYKQVIKGCTAGLMLLVIYIVFARVNGFEPSRGWLILSWALSIALIGMMRFFVRRVVYRLRESGWLTSRALIVGAGEGLSAALARRLAGAGMKVGLAARSVQKLDALAAETGAATQRCDATSRADVAALFAAMDGALGGPPEVVIYNASHRVRGPFVGLDPAEVERTLAVCAFGGFLVAAVGDDERVELPLEVTVGEELPAKLKLTANFPSLRGTAQSSFKYKLTINNDSGRDATINLNAQAPLSSNVLPAMCAVPPV